MKTWRTLTVLTLCVSVGAAAAVGQDTPQNAPTQEAPKPAARAVGSAPQKVIKIFPLKYIQASQALETILPLLGKGTGASEKAARFAVDTHSNAVIAAGDQETLRLVEALLPALDKPQNHREGSEPPLTIIKLHYANPIDVAMAMNKLELKGVSACYADERTKTLFVKGTDEAIAQLRKLVTQLDLAAPTSHGPDLSLRIVWLVDKSQAGAESAPVPNDWNPAIENLRKQVNFGELRMATQVVVTFTPVEGAKFESTATAKLKQTSLLHVAGLFTQSAQGGRQLQLQLSAKEEGTPQEICKVNTTCSAALHWQPVIVGLTTVNSQPSVFVIQFIPD
jgi:Bacterial type II/III secretion system short domain